ncbi:MAG: hypothetical protein B6226_01780 [Candidatus Cloacimonetes bacterium 4572_65]|nr:MAG: hypothetical protein B6226_01780 [Candidatus Cloacimonetes bacterium 4572_65]
MLIKKSNSIVYCKKFQETVSFYKDLIGLEVTFSKSWFVEFKLTESSFISIVDENRATIKSCSGKGITISLNVENIYHERELFIEKGINPTALKEIWGSLHFFVHDPEGTRIEFWEEISVTKREKKSS